MTRMEAMTTSNNNKEKFKIAGLTFLFVLSLTFIIGGIVYEEELDARLKVVTEVCGEDDEGYDTVYSTSTQQSINWVYNLTNPLEYLTLGEDARFHELGGYAYDLELTRANPKFSPSSDKVTYTLYSSGTFNPSDSPSGLGSDDQLWAMNMPYLAILGAARSEAVVLLSATCSTTQLGTIGNTAVRVCRSEEINTDAVCQCCSPTPLENSTLCSDITSPTSKAGGLISYLAQHDGGVRLDSTPSAFPLSSGAFSALVVRKSVNHLLLGTPSALLGFFKYQGGTDADKASTANTTADIVEACVAMDHCPTLPELMVQIAAAANLPAVLALLATLDCSGLIPGTTGLVAAGMTEERALELRYLEGIDCGVYTPTLATAGLLMATAGMGSSYTCASGALPCCLDAFSIPGMSSGSGMGCMMWVSGTVVTRQTYSVDEAYRYLSPSPDNELYTGCTSDENAFSMISWQGRQAIDRWYVPDSYTYPAMSWADPIVKPVSAAGGVAGEMTVVNITGNTIFGRRGRGVTSGFLDYDLTDGAPINKDETIVWVQGLVSRHLKYIEKSEVEGIETNTFRYNYPDNYTAAEDEARQRTGEMPYARLHNLRHSKGIPATVSSPNYLGVDEDVYSQSSNADKAAADGGGLLLYRTRDGYSPSSSLLATPELMTASSVAEMKDHFTDFVKIEPASGVTLLTRALNMASTFTWNCNPTLDATCGLMATPHNSSDPLCYILGNGKQMPCSNANVFTPRVRGGKVLPVFWSRATLKPAGATDTLKGLTDLRHAMAVMSLVTPLLFVAVLAVTRPAVIFERFGDGRVLPVEESYEATEITGHTGNTNTVVDAAAVKALEDMADGNEKLIDSDAVISY